MSNGMLNKEFVIYKEGNYEEKWSVKNDFLLIERSGDLITTGDPSKLEIIGMDKLKNLRGLSLFLFPMKEFFENVELPRSIEFLSLVECFFNGNNIKSLEKIDNIKSLVIMKPYLAESIITNRQNYFELKSNYFDLKNFEDLNFLEVLRIQSANISRIYGLETFEKLRILDLSNNNISKIEGVYTLVNLEELWLESNQISKIEGLDNLLNLKKLSLYNNKIMKIEGLDQLINLEELFLSNYHIFNEIYINKANLQQYFGHLKKLRVLNGQSYPKSKEYLFPRIL